MNFVKLYKVIYVVWLAPGARNEKQQQKTHSAPYILYRNQMWFFNKIMIFAKQDAIKVNQPQQP